MKNIIFNSKYQNLHMDRAKLDSMKTITVNINSNLASSTTPVLLYQYEHNLGYVPQFWGLWDIQYAAGDLGGAKRRGYGYIVHNTGFGLVASFYYTVDSTSIKLYFLFNTFGSATTAGTVAKFTGYLFSNGRNDQDYTS
jgi:hypothetical protein